jgi:1,4-alpha-glucan branching enzyme
MIKIAKTCLLLAHTMPTLCHEHNDNKVLAFYRAGLLFVFNFHPSRSHVDYEIRVPAGSYHTLLESDDPLYGGHGRRLKNCPYQTFSDSNGIPAGILRLYLPSRTAIVFRHLSTTSHTGASLQQNPPGSS